MPSPKSFMVPRAPRSQVVPFVPGNARREAAPHVTVARSPWRALYDRCISNMYASRFLYNKAQCRDAIYRVSTNMRLYKYASLQI